MSLAQQDVHRLRLFDDTQPALAVLTGAHAVSLQAFSVPASGHLPGLTIARCPHRYTSQPFATNGVRQPLDGMVINPYSLPGGAYSGFNLGMSVVHEAGCESCSMRSLWGIGGAAWASLHGTV